MELSPMTAKSETLIEASESVTVRRNEYLHIQSPFSSASTRLRGPPTRHLVVLEMSSLIMDNAYISNFGQ